MPYNLVDFDEAKHLAGVIRLQAPLWGDDTAANEAYFRWKYLENPYSPKPIVSIAESDGTVVGMRGAYGALWQVGNVSQAIFCLGDTVIEPTARKGSNLASLINAHCVDQLLCLGHEAALNFSASPLVQALSLRSGWQQLGDYQEAMHVTASARVSKRLLNRFPEPLSKRLRQLAYSLPSPHRLAASIRRKDPQSIKNISVNETARIEEMAALADRLTIPNSIRHVKDEKYFRWRLNHPTVRPSHFLFWSEDKGINGYIILASRNSIVGYIIDWEAENESILTELLIAAILTGGFQKLSIWANSPNPILAPALQSAGFIETKLSGWGYKNRAPGPLIKDLTAREGGKDLIDSFSKWDLRMLFGDTI